MNDLRNKGSIRPINGKIHNLISSYTAGNILSVHQSISRPWQLLVLSAKTPAALDRISEDLLHRFREKPDLKINDVAFTLQAGRQLFPYRKSILCRNLQEAVYALENNDPRLIQKTEKKFKKPKVVFLLPDRGILAEQAKEIYQSEKVFREHFDQCAKLFKKTLGEDIREWLNQVNGDNNSECLLFAIEYALAQMWMAWGVKPSLFFGQGVGEFVGASLAGIYSLENTIKLLLNQESKDTVVPKTANIPLLADGITHGAFAPNEPTAMVELLREKSPIFLELGAPKVINELKQYNIENTANKLLLSTLPDPKEQQSGFQCLTDTVGKLYLADIKIDWKAFHKEQQVYRVALPTYSFEKQRYWFSDSFRTNNNAAHNSGNKPIIQQASVSPQNSFQNGAGQLNQPGQQIQNGFQSGAGQQNQPGQAIQNGFQNGAGQRNQPDQAIPQQQQVHPEVNQEALFQNIRCNEEKSGTVPQQVQQTLQTGIAATPSRQTEASQGAETISQTATEISQTTLCPVVGYLINTCEELLEISGIHEEDNLISLGGNSMFAMKLAANINKKFQTDISPHHLFSEPNIKALAKEIRRLSDIVPDLEPEAVQSVQSTAMDVFTTTDVPNSINGVAASEPLDQALEQKLEILESLTGEEIQKLLIRLESKR